MKIEFSKEDVVSNDLDILFVPTHGNIKHQINQLNAIDKASYASVNVNLYLCDRSTGLLKYIKDNSPWSFNEIHYYDSIVGSDIECVNSLANESSSKYMMPITQGIIHSDCIHQIAFSISESPQSCLGISIVTDDKDKSNRFIYTPIGMASLTNPVITREAWRCIGGLDASYNSIHSSVQDITIRLFMNDYKFIFMTTDVCLQNEDLNIRDFYPDEEDSKKLIDKFCHLFPEEKYRCELNYYLRDVENGYKIMSESTVVIAGLARGIAGHWRATGEARFNHLASLFKDHRFIIYENDSEDETTEYLKEWQSKDPDRILLTTENLDRERLGGMGSTRVVRMAEYRNKCLERLKNEFSDFDYYIVIDMDLTGGFSYDGVANTIGSEMIWSAVAANGKNARRSNHVYWDTFAHRDVGHGMGTHGGRMRNYHGKYADSGRGDPWVMVNSAFGGMGIYKVDDIINSKYTGEASEHVPFHLDIIDKGGKIFMNPNLVVLYNYLDWCEDKNRNLNFNIHKFYEVMEKDYV